VFGRCDHPIHLISATACEIDLFVEINDLGDSVICISSSDKIKHNVFMNSDTDYQGEPVTVKRIRL